MNLVVGEGLVLLIHNQSPCGSKNGVSDACRTGASVVGAIWQGGMITQLYDKLEMSYRQN